MALVKCAICGGSYNDSVNGAKAFHNQLYMHKKALESINRAEQNRFNAIRQTQTNTTTTTVTSRGIKCPTCGNSFSTADAVERHILSAHPKPVATTTQQQPQTTQSSSSGGSSVPLPYNVAKSTGTGNGTQDHNHATGPINLTCMTQLMPAVHLEAQATRFQRSDGYR